MLKYLKACPFCGHAPEVVKDPQIMELFESKQFKPKQFKPKQFKPKQFKPMSFELKREKE